MKENEENREQLRDELDQLRRRVAELEGLQKLEQLTLELEKKEQLLTAFQQIARMMSSSLEREKILDILATQIIETGIFRSLMIALVHEDSQTIEVVRNYIRMGEDDLPSPQGAIKPSLYMARGSKVIQDEKIIGIVHSLDDDTWTSRTARTGKMIVTGGYGHHLTEEPEEPGLTKKVAYFIPIKKEDRVLAVLATGSQPEEEEMMRHRIEAMQSLMDQMAVALENARLYETVQREIAERKQAEEALTEGHSRLRILIDHLTNTVYFKDTESRFIIGNREIARVMGVKGPDELIGKTDFDFYPQELAEQYYADEQALLQSGQSLVDKEEPLVDAEGNEKVFLTTKVPLRDSQGKIVGLVGMGQDITERKRMEQELIRTQRLRAVGELSAGVSHNLNNVLTSVLGPAQLLRQRTEDPRMLEDVDGIIAGAIRARDLVRRLHTSVKGMKEGVQSVRVNEVIEEVVLTLRPRWKDQPESKGFSIEVITELKEVPLIQGTVTGLYDILTNLLLNAVEALPAGGQVTIDTRTVGEEVQISVADTGVGMDEETRRRVFEPFFTTRMDVGSGLGLSTAYGTLKSWGGSIEVESSPGKGSRFVVQLPAWVDPGDQQEETWVRRGRLLIVEDDEWTRKLLLRLLSETHQVSAVEDGRKGLEAFAPGELDAALIDLGMPEMPGDQVAREMKRLDPTVATVLITGWSLESDDPRLHAFDFFLQKPFGDLEEVKRVVMRAIELHHRLLGDS